MPHYSHCCGATGMRMQRHVGCVGCAGQVELGHWHASTIEPGQSQCGMCNAG
jgi:hypothetical protein